MFQFFWQIGHRENAELIQRIHQSLPGQINIAADRGKTYNLLFHQTCLK